MIKQTLKRLFPTAYKLYVKFLARNDVDWYNLDRYKKNILIQYKQAFGVRPNLRNPQTFSEKMMWLRLNDNSPLKSQLTDKILVRKWISEKIGDEFLVPLFGVFDSPDQIDFNTLPEKFVIKTNHGCAFNIIVKDKSNLDVDSVKQKLAEWLKFNYFYHAGEWQYKDIQPRILIEKYIPAMDSDDIPDYKFFCFNGVPQFCMYCCERASGNVKNTFFDMNWNNLEVSYFGSQLNGNVIPKPRHFEQMIEIARILSKEFKHVRVDLYNIEGRIYFGEMTFTSYGGYTKFTKPDFNRELGDYLTL